MCFRIPELASFILYSIFVGLGSTPSKDLPDLDFHI